MLNYKQNIMQLFDTDKENYLPKEFIGKDLVKRKINTDLEYKGNEKRQSLDTRNFDKTNGTITHSPRSRISCCC